MKVIRPSLLTIALVLAAIPAIAVERFIAFDAPRSAAPGASVHVAVLASTNAGDGEQVGFFHGEYSTDGGKQWNSFCYDANAGEVAKRELNLTLGGPGSKAIVRVRVAFRGGQAGDVDFAGEPIKWNETWGQWRTPPTKYLLIYAS